MSNELLSYINSKESEESVLSSLIMHPEMIEEVFIKPEMMSQDINKKTLQAIQDLVKEGYKIDIATVLEFVSQKGEYDTGSLFVRLKELAMSEFQSTNIVYHQNKIIEAYKKRETTKALSKAINSINDKSSTELYKELIDRFEILESITNTNEDQGHISKVMQSIYDQLNSSDKKSYMSTHFSELDKCFKFKRQDMIILAARPSMGKTAFAMNLAINHAFKNNMPVVVFSKEMSNESIGTRILSSETNVTMNSMKEPEMRLTLQDWEKISYGIGEFSSKKIHMFDNHKMDTTFIRSKSKEISKIYPGEHVLIVVDYLQIIDADNNRLNRNLQVDQISKDLKNIAREIDGTMLALSQLSRDVEKRQDKRPMNSDLRDSGSIEQDADVIAFLYRDDYYDKNTENKNITEVIVSKNRDGQVGTANLLFRKEISKFINII